MPALAAATMTVLLQVRRLFRPRALKREFGHERMLPAAAIFPGASISMVMMMSFAVEMPPRARPVLILCDTPRAFGIVHVAAAASSGGDSQAFGVAKKTIASPAMLVAVVVLRPAPKLFVGATASIAADDVEVAKPVQTIACDAARRSSAAAELVVPMSYGSRVIVSRRGC